MQSSIVTVVIQKKISRGGNRSYFNPKALRARRLASEKGDRNLKIDRLIMTGARGEVIKGIMIKQLKKIPDERGSIYHMLRCDDPIFEKFGEIYFSVVYPGVIKGWHLHGKMTLNYAVIQGMIKLVLYDDRENSPTKGKLMELFIGEENYCLVKIPPRIWNGFKGIGTKPAIVANCATLPHDPTEITRMDPFTIKIPYNWGLKHK